MKKVHAIEEGKKYLVNFADMKYHPSGFLSDNFIVPNDPLPAKVISFGLTKVHVLWDTGNQITCLKQHLNFYEIPKEEMKKTYLITAEYNIDYIPCGYASGTTKSYFRKITITFECENPKNILNELHYFFRSKENASSVKPASTNTHIRNLIISVMQPL